MTERRNPHDSRPQGRPPVPPQADAVNDPGPPPAGRQPAGPDQPARDQLISIADIRAFFRLGRTAAYELTHRPGFPDPVEISPRCYRWWASEVDAFAASLRRSRAQRPGRGRNTPPPGPETLRITGTARPVRSRREQP